MKQGKYADRSSRRPKIGILIFLCLYVAMVVLILMALNRLMTPLEQQLSDYEAAQLDNRCVQVFDELFADPDWEKLYALSGRKDTLYEGAEAYAAYMEAKADGGKLTFEEVYSARSDVHRYEVYLGEETVAAFTMTGSDGTGRELPNWTLDTVEVYFERTVSVTVEKIPGYTVRINGVALDDSFTIRSVSTLAEAYLPQGVHGYRMEQQYIDGLLMEPEVCVLNEDGEAVEVARDPETGIYTLVLPEPAEMTDAEQALARNAAVADAKFSMGRISATELRKYFDANSQVYADIVGNPIFIQSNNGITIDESAVEVGDYCRYSDDLFSARVKLTVRVLRKDDTVKIYELDKTYFFTRSGGEYLVSGYTNEPVLERVEQVRLTFESGDGERVYFMADSGADRVAPPQITVPENDELVGWATRTDDGCGNVTMTVRLLPDGTVLGELEPMTLYPVFRSMQQAE